MYKYVFYGKIDGLVYCQTIFCRSDLLIRQQSLKFFGKARPSIAYDAIINYPTVVGSNNKKRGLTPSFLLALGEVGFEPTTN